MKIFSRMAPIQAFLLLIAFILPAPGCGKDKTSTVAVPQNSVLTVSPTSFTIKGIAANTTVNFTVTATYSDGKPIPSAAIDISGPLAVPRSNAHYQFYYYPDGVTPVNSSFKAQTDDFGVYKFSIIVYGPNNAFDDSINISSGTAFVSVTLSST